jgi:ATP-dependent helicase HrpB
LNASRHTLPIDYVLPDFLRLLTDNPVTILSASPGAGKTTRVPLALFEHPAALGKRIIMLEPRRLAAQRAAEYMASLQGEDPGESIGYRIRGTSRVSHRTRVEILTEGILTRMIQETPDLPGTGILIFDEFHERSIHADLGLALALDSQEHLRPDLRIIIMSATLDGIGLRRILPEAPVVDSPGRQFPVETVYATFAPTGPLEKSVAQAVRRALNETEGDILVFLPGRRELRRTRDALIDLKIVLEAHIHLLHGEADPKAQRGALMPAPGGQRKIVLSTSVAETSVTIDGVRVVIDSGLARVPQFDPRRGMSGLDTVPVSVATADQRRGRAGRQSAGVCYRLWTEQQQGKLEPYPVPEIRSTDLAPLALELARWGSADALGLRLIDSPPESHFAQARDLLRALDALDDNGRLTSHGRRMAELPIHPRLAHMVLTAKEAGLGSDACTLAALLDGPPLPSGRTGTDVDLAQMVHALDDQQTSDRTARVLIHSEANRLRRMIAVTPAPLSNESLGMLLALAYPDRIARQRRENSRRYLLTGGTGAVLPEWSLLSRHEFLVVGEVDNSGVDARILLAAPITVDAIRHVSGNLIEVLDQVQWDSRNAAVVARRVERLGAVVLNEQSSPLTGETVVHAMVEGIRDMGIEALPWEKSVESFRSRCEWLRRSGLAGNDWPDLNADALMSSLKNWLAPFLNGITRKEHLASLDLTRILSTLLTSTQRQMLDRLAPASLLTPSGSRVALQYGDTPQPAMPVRLQEMFGQTESPTVGGGAINVVLHLLSPAGRPLAVTSDLRSFWANAYPEVRKQMRGRYPKHRWPENPIEAAPGPSRKKARQ